MRIINKILIVLFICARNSIHALPVQSKALENVDDQLFWQAAWFSEDSNDRAASPFTSDSKRISPKSIFIIPEKSTSYCSPGYRIDANGKCIKIVSVQQTSEESKLASLITTDDTANFDYDYWNEEDEYTQTTDNESLKLPLVPILNESHENENDNNDDDDDNNAKKVIFKENDEINSTSVTESSLNVITTSHMPPTSTEQTFQNFHQENKTDSVQVIIATLSSDNYEWENVSDKNESGSSSIMMTYDHASTETSVNEFKNENNEEEKEEKENFKSQTTTIAPTETSTKNEIMQDRNDADSQNIEPTSSSSNSTDEDDLLDYSIFNETTLQTEDTIIEKINFDDVSLMQNESLLISYENVNSTNIDYEDSTTTIEPLIVDLTSSTVEYEGSTDDSDDSSPSMPTTIDLEEQSYDRDQESKNKFVYQLLTSVTEKTITTSTESYNNGKIKFPSDEPSKNNRIKFPDDEIASQTTQSTSVFSWPRENHKITTNIFQFWNQQPLIADSLQNIRANSKSFSDNFFPYTRNQKVQIVTSQKRY